MGTAAAFTRKLGGAFELPDRPKEVVEVESRMSSPESSKQGMLRVLLRLASTRLCFALGIGGKDPASGVLLIVDTRYPTS